MKCLLGGILAVISCLSPSLAIAKQHVVRRSITVMGGRSCRDWTKASIAVQHLSAQPGSEFIRTANITWLVGYVSGINIASSRSEDLLRDLDADTLTDWTDEYCLEHKDADVTDAVDSLLKKLGRYPY